MDDIEKRSFPGLKDMAFSPGRLRDGHDGESSSCREESPPRVLVVEDDPMTRIIMQEKLQQSGFLVQEAEDGLHALSAFQDFQPDIVLMDVVMPRMDGITSCGRLRQLPGGENLPIVMVTGLGDLESIQRAYEVGATDFITKPIQWLILEQRLRYMLRAGRITRELAQSKKRLMEAQRMARLGNWEWDLQENVLYCSLEASRIHGLEGAEHIMPYEEFLKRVHAEDRALVSESFEALRRHGRSLAVDHRILLPDGSEKVVHHQAEAVMNREGGVLAVMGAILDVTERKIAEEKILYLALHDTLTGLPNRMYLKDQLDRALARSKRFNAVGALLFIDLDCFKRINDTLGHDIGDRLLQRVAERINHFVRKEDSVARGPAASTTTVARLGGDEFTVLLNDIKRVEDAGRVARRILDALARPFDLGSCEVYIGASIGITVFPHDGEDVDALLKSADTAMYHAKDQGRNNYQFFERSMHDRALQRLSLESAMRRGWENREFFLCYQPQWDIGTGEMVGVEALMRWRSPEKGLIPPDDFIPVAEDTGMIIPMGEWVLREACRECVSWQELSQRPLRVSVNLSQRQFKFDRLLDMVGRILREVGLDPSLLELELTETIVMDHAEETIAILHKLKAMGVYLSIDDFGTGYSSLSYLKRLPIDILKIDGSFVKDIPSNSNDMAITSAIIAMARSLRIQAIAEGVETAEQLEFLRNCQCESMQGFFRCPPVSAEELRKLLLSSGKA